MAKQKKRTQSRKYCAIQGACLIWKQKIWLAICEFLWSLTNQNAWFVTSFCIEITLLCTVFKKAALLSTNQNGDIFSCILLVIKAWSKAVSQTCLRSIFSGTQRGIKTVENYSCFFRSQIVLLYFSWQEF